VPGCGRKKKGGKKRQEFGNWHHHHHQPVRDPRDTHPPFPFGAGRAVKAKGGSVKPKPATPRVARARSGVPVCGPASARSRSAARIASHHGSPRRHLGSQAMISCHAPRTPFSAPRTRRFSFRLPARCIDIDPALCRLHWQRGRGA